MNHTSPLDAQFVQMLDQPHVKGFTHLYDTYSPILYKMLLRLVDDTEKAEDLLQDAFVSLWVNAHRYDPSRGSLFGWLVSIARHLALSELRAQKVRQVAATYLANHAVSSSQTSPVEGILYQSMGQQLAPKYRIVIELIYYRGYTYQEVADLLDLPLGTIKTRSQKGLALLKAFFSQDIQHYRPA